MERFGLGEVIDVEDSALILHPATADHLQLQFLVVLQIGVKQVPEILIV
jgi:hypothetical protein